MLRLLLVVVVCLLLPGCAFQSLDLSGGMGRRVLDDVIYPSEPNEILKSGTPLDSVDPELLHTYEAPKHRIGLLVPLTGQNRVIGQHAFDAVQLALFDLEIENVDIIPIDTADSIDEIMESLKKHKVDVVIGPVFADVVEKVYAKLERGSKLPILSLSNDIKLAGKKNLFVLGFIVTQQVGRIANYAAEHGYNEMYAVLPRNRYGSVIQNIFTRNAGVAGYKIRGIEHYASISSNVVREMNQAALNIRQDIENSQILSFGRNHEKKKYAILIAETGKKLNSIVKHLELLRTDDVEYKYIGIGRWDTDAVYSNAEMNGSWFTNLSMSDFNDFEEKFRRSYRYRPIKIASIAYDATSLVSALVEKGISPDDFREVLTNSLGFRGSTGLFRILPNGLNERAIAVYQIKNGRVLTLDPAPTAFIDDKY